MTINTFNPWKLLVAGCLIIKPLLFYRLMDIQGNLLFLWIATALILILLFGSFKYLWVPYGLYVLFSVLMFCDVTHNADFSGYVSLNLVGSVKYLGDVGDVIKAVIRPEFWMVFLDLPLLAVSIYNIRLAAAGKERLSTVGDEQFGVIRKGQFANGEEWFSPIRRTIFRRAAGGDGLSVLGSVSVRHLAFCREFGILFPRIKDMLLTTTTSDRSMPNLAKSFYIIEEEPRTAFLALQREKSHSYSNGGRTRYQQGI